MNQAPLSEEQLLATESQESHILLIAPPGCGKTEVMARRAAGQISLLEENQRVLALTLTKRARSNLDERLRSVLGHTQTRRKISVRNIHGFATEVVLAHGRTLGLDMETLKLPRNSTLRRATEAEGGGADKYEAEEVLGEVKRSPLSDEGVLAALQARSGEPGVALAERVEQARQHHNQLHYEDILRHAQRLLQIPAIARLYQAHFGAVLVDEFQDLSMQQLDLAMLSCSSRRTFAGDPLQGVFSWAGANPSLVEAEIRKSCGEPIRLRESYRSSPKVLAMVNAVSKQLDPASELKSAVPDEWTAGGCAAALVLSDRSSEAEILSSLVEKILDSAPHASVGIIVRAKWRREDIDLVFGKAANFPVRRWDLALDEPDIVDRIKSTIARLPAGTTVADARIAAIDDVDPSDIETLALVDEAFDTLEQHGANTAREALRSIRSSDPKQAVGPGVHLLNAHTGKGQQFDWVFVVGLEEGHLPAKRSKEGESLLEEHRTLLVMLSRARHGLIVTRVQTASGPFGEYEAKRSRFCSAFTEKYMTLEEVEGHIAALP